jgi:hypothetical protein
MNKKSQFCLKLIPKNLNFAVNKPLKIPKILARTQTTAQACWTLDPPVAMAAHLEGHEYSPKCSFRSWIKLYTDFHFL